LIQYIYDPFDFAQAIGSEAQARRGHSEYNRTMNSKLVKLVFFTPLTHADIVRKAMGDAGAGQMGNYSHCTFSSRGQGRFKPLKGAHPAIGKVGKLEIIEEERIETLCPREKVAAVINAIKRVHPYEELAYDIIPLLGEKDL